MNEENYPILHTSALDGHHVDTLPPRFTWTLFAAKLWLLAAFVGMSLVAVAARLWLVGETRPPVAFASSLVGAMLAAVAWRRVAQLFERAERESTDATAEPEPVGAPERIAPAKTLLLAPHR